MKTQLNKEATKYIEKFLEGKIIWHAQYLLYLGSIAY